MRRAHFAAFSRLLSLFKGLRDSELLGGGELLVQHGTHRKVGLTICLANVKLHVAAERAAALARARRRLGRHRCNRQGSRRRR